MKKIFCRNGKCIELEETDIENEIKNIGRYDSRDINECDHIDDPVKQIECDLLKEMLG